MERLTKRLHDGKVVTDCDSCEQKKDKQCTFSECRASLIKRLAAYEGIAEPCGGLDRLRELAEADKDGRVVVLPCKVGERWADEDGRAVRITAVIVSIEPFGTNINIYFDYEDATPDDAGSDCVTNWDYFSRHYTCIETERATEGTTE